MAEGALPHKGLRAVGGHVHHLANEPVYLRGPCKLLIGDARYAQLQLQVGCHGEEVRVAAPLAVAVDRPLHLDRARLHRGHAVGHRHLAVVVGVDAQGC